MVYILKSVRTPIGKFRGSLSKYSAVELGSFVLASLRKELYSLDLKPDLVIMGQTVQAGSGQNPARGSALLAGFPPEIEAYTINEACASSARAIANAFLEIVSGRREIVIAGGFESETNSPFYLKNSGRIRKKIKMGSFKLSEKSLEDLGEIEVGDSLIDDGLIDRLYGVHMGELAALQAKEYGISREEQDEFAFYSNQKALRAQKRGYFKEEMLTLKELDRDECVREDITLERLRKLKPIFGGYITAGTSSKLADGASALLIVSERIIKEYSLKPEAKIVDFAYAYIDPKAFSLAPYYAIQKLLQKKEIRRRISRVEDFDLIEINEAFAASVLLVCKKLGIYERNVKELSEEINIKGGAIALGHLLGGNAARLLTTLSHSLKDFNKKTGLLSLCIGGGGGFALMIERV